MSVHVFEDNQDIPLQNMPLWDKDYLELKATENQQMQEQFYTLSFTA